MQKWCWRRKRRKRRKGRKGAGGEVGVEEEEKGMDKEKKQREEAAMQ